MDELNRFKSQKPDVKQLRKRYPELSDLLTGKFADSPNVYDLPEGRVVSWTLLQGKKPQDPTYGRIPLGHFEFPTTHTEEVTILEGVLEVELGGKKYLRFKGQKIATPPNSTLKIDVRTTPIYYFCQYK